ncbi:hypothetical protein FRC11_001790, partial [Ceratobasidium sp. 423]
MANPSLPEPHTNLTPISSEPAAAPPAPVAEGSTLKRKWTLDPAAYDAEKHKHLLDAGHKASRAQNLGYLCVMNLGDSFQRASESYVAPEVLASDPRSERMYAHSVPSNAPPLSVHARLCPTPAEVHSHNLGIVEFELNKYIAERILPMESMGDIDIVAYRK